MDYKIVEKDHINYLTVPKLEVLGLTNMLTLNKINFKFDTDIEGDEVRLINKNLRLISNELNFSPDTLYTAKQSHTNEIRVIGLDEDFIKMPFGRKYYDIDGMITNRKNIMIITRYADCTPIILFDKKLKVQGNIHSGWRGTKQKIVLEGIRKMKKYFNTNPDDIIAVIGPAIGKDDFEVTIEVYNMFMKEFPEYKDTIRIKDEKHWLIDTREINKRLLLESGVKEENIVSIDISTVKDSRFHSYRRDKKNHGLMGFVTIIK